MQVEYLTFDESRTYTAEEIASAFKGKPNAIGLFSREFVRRARVLKDSSGQYLWNCGTLNHPGPDTIAGRSYRVLEDVPRTLHPFKLDRTVFHQLITEALIAADLLPPGEQVDRVLYEIYADQDCVGLTTVREAPKESG